MGVHRDRLGEATANARQLRAALGADVREARLAAGLSQEAAASAVGMSHAQLGRIERVELRDLTIEQASRACAAVGLKLVGRAYPHGDPIRDAAQVALLARLHRLLSSSVRWRTEVALRVPGDLRAWDAEARFPDASVKIEAETRIRDIQAIDRRIALKQRDDAVEVVVLLINDSPANRATLAQHREALRSRFPADGREILRAFRTGRCPTASGILFL